MAKYKSKRQYRSRLASQQNKKMKKQTTLIIFLTIGLVILLIFVGIPLIIRFAIFIGNLRSTTTPIEPTDTIPPQTPQLAASFEATNSADLSFTGFTESGATVSLYHNNQEKAKTLVDASGQFSFQDVTLEEGANNFYVIARDPAGNESQRSLNREVIYDTEPPLLTIDQPEDGALIVGATRQTIDVIGNTDVGSRLSLNGRVVLVKSDGSFNTQFALDEGDNSLEFIAQDQAGNQTTQELTVEYQRE